MQSTASALLYHILPPPLPYPLVPLNPPPPLPPSTTPVLLKSAAIKTHAGLKCQKRISNCQNINLLTLRCLAFLRGGGWWWRLGGEGWELWGRWCRREGGGRGERDRETRESGVKCHWLRALMGYGERADIQAGCWDENRQRKQRRQNILPGRDGREVVRTLKHWDKSGGEKREARTRDTTSKICRGGRSEKVRGE